MKKNKVMRIASILMALALISTCAISGTFAKYVTKVEGTDSARVAKWGIVLDLDAGNVFAKEYETTDTNGYAGLAVKATENVVAPGTSSNEVGETISGTVKGTPEVATRYTLEIKDLTDIVLPAGTYPDYTKLVKADDGTYGYTGTFTLAEDYAPVKWNFGVKKGNTTLDLVSVAAQLGQDFDGFSFTDAQSIMSASNIMDRLMDMLEDMAPTGAQNAKYSISNGTITVSMDFEPGTEMDYTFFLTWVWDFDDNGEGTYDQADTYLGNVAAGVVTDANAKTTLEATVTATAVQID